ncbi:wax ester/triacylglycerol synthase domain-containing protein [Streptomyces sp. NPDC048489]|uniref:wax ester/triacylglycerol synthase domain-containing protein n=1 Tax=Streptomyces sp. NPDC048489 TaxID=3154504 RepID=UPI003437D18A
MTMTGPSPAVPVTTTVPRPSAVDGCFLSYERDEPGFRPYVGAVLEVTGSCPGPDPVRAQIADRVARMPSLACRVGRRGGRTVWELDPAFDPRRHVHEVRVDDGPASLDRAVDALLGEPIDAAAPRWGVWLLRGYSPDRYALFYRAHHAAQDGQAVLDALTALFGVGPAVPPREPVAEAPGGRGTSGFRNPLARVRNIPARAVAQNAADTVRGLRSTLTWTPHRSLTGRTRLLSAAVPASWPRDVAGALGATPNDVCLAALAEAVRDWVPAEWRARPGRGRELHVALPVSLRPPEERFAVGNRVSAVRVPLSYWAASPADRVVAVARATRRVRTEGMRRVLRAQLECLPEWLVYRFVRQSCAASSAVDTSGLLRVPRRLALGADPVEGVVPTLFLHGDHLFAVSFLSYQGRVRVSFTVDRALDDVGDLAALWAAAVERLWREVTAGPRGPHGPADPAGPVSPADPAGPAGPADHFSHENHGSHAEHAHHAHHVEHRDTHVSRPGENS